ncbi:MAG: DoxX family protein [Geminicoccaceae bacterium]
MTTNVATHREHTARLASLLALRVTTGFLLIWFGLNRLFSAQVPLALSKNVDLESLPTEFFGAAAGGAEFVVGLLCVVGLFRRWVLPIQAIINGITAASVWWAIVDPFRWYISGVDRIVFNSHVFYPTSITFVACIVLIVFRNDDRWALDNWPRRPRSTAAAGER